MLRTHTCGELREKDAGKKIVLCGWVDSIRVQGKIGFLLLRDRYGITQVFLNPSLAKEFGTVSKESVVMVEGEVKKRPDNQVRKEMSTGGIEVSANTIEVLNAAETPLPIDLGQDTTAIDKRLDYRFLDLRQEKVQDIFIIRSKIARATADYFDHQGFVAIHTPKLTASGVESGAEEFKIPYFGKTASLAQSPQIYKQMFVVSGLEKVYEIAPIFRAEKSHTTRHLTEFIGIDLEMGFIKDEHDVMKVVEEYLISLLTTIKKECAVELEKLGVTIDLPKTIPKLSLIEARKILKEQGKKIPEDDDLDAEGERMIGEYVKKKHKSDFV
ncbi:MAG: amino acid--tRNA ligase-related protein, partial [Nanoarchaeota archaeon]